MYCIDCKDSRDSCGTTLSSSCIWFSGEFPKFITPNDITCKPNINDVFKLYGNKLNYLVEQHDIKSLDKKCLGYDVNSITPLKLDQILINETCDLKTLTADLENQLDTFNIGEHEIVIDLQGLTPDGAACATAPNTYTLQSLLNIIFTKLSTL